MTSTGAGLTRRIVASALMCLTVLCGLVSCGNQGDAQEVVLYVSADEYVATRVIAAFEEKTGITVKMVTDSEVNKTTGLVERLRAERDNPQADVYWSSEVFMTVLLADEDTFEPFESDAVRDWPEKHRDPERRWYGFGARARVIVYHPERLAAEDVPKVWSELTRPQYKGRIVMADPRFGTTGGHLGVMKAYWDRHVVSGYYSAFVEGLVDNEVRLLTSGNAGVVQAVASGEADLGMTDTDDVWAAQAQGLNVELVYPRHHNDETVTGGGTLLIPNTVARVRGGPNPEPAAALIEFLLSEQGERVLAESDAHNIPLRSGLADEYAEYQVDDPLIVSYRRAAYLRTAAIRELLGGLNVNGAPAEPEATETPGE